MKNNFTLFFFVIIIINSCTDSGNSIINNNDDLDNGSQTLYSIDIQPIFNENCTGCHGSTDGSASLSLNNYDNLMVGISNNGPIIIPGDASNSVLIQKINGSSDFGNRMPPNNQTYFDSNEEELQLIIDWINEGAINN